MWKLLFLDYDVQHIHTLFAGVQDDFSALKNMPPSGGVILYTGCMSSKPSLSPSEVTYLVVRWSRARLLAWEQPDSSAEQLTVGEAAERRQPF